MKHVSVCLIGVFDEAQLAYLRNALSTFPKGIVRKNRSNRHGSAVGMFFSFLVVAGPQLNSAVLQGSARFAQGFDSSARQAPETGEQMILANQGQNREQTSRKLIRTCPCVLFDSQH